MREGVTLRSACTGLALALGALGCGGHASSPPAAPQSLVEQRPYGFKAPAGYDPARPTPLVLVLHGYSSSGLGLAQYFGMLEDADQHGYLLAYPDGLIDSRNNRFWNATDFCCNFDGRAVDDVAYLGAVIDDVATHYNLDPKRVYVAGHSNGGFMAYRLACDIGSRIAAIVSLAGAMPKVGQCVGASPVNVLQVHGDADQTIFYGGSGGYPSAEESVAMWAQKNSCVGPLGEAGANIDLDTQISGAETTVRGYAGCPAAGAAGLWTIVGGGHVPSLGPSWADQVWAYLSAHPKP
jgi:polyhydroxybutyrate depolymerase